MNKEELIEQIEILATQLKFEDTMRHDNLELRYGRMNGHNGWVATYGYRYYSFADEMEVALDNLLRQMRAAVSHLIKETEIKLLRLRKLNK